MIERLKNLLCLLNDSLNPDGQNEIEDRYQKSLNWEPVEKLPLVVTYPYPKITDYPHPFPHREIFDSPEKMLFNELVHAFDTSIFLHSKVNDNLPFTIRANFGTVVVASLMGGKIEQREDNPPWVRHFETMDEFEAVFEKDPHDLSQGLCPRVIATYKFYHDTLADYPNLKKCIKLVLPDLQGPLDSLELLRGSKIYEDFIMEPEMVEKGLHLMAVAQIGLAMHLKQFTTDGPENYSHQHATTIKGNILIRNDSAIMISPEMYAQQVAHHDEMVLKEMGGGGIHSCGKIDFNIPEFFKLSSVRSFDFGQSYLNDLEMVWSMALGKKIPLIRVRVGKEDLLSGKIKKRFPTGISLVYEAASFEDAQFVAKAYKEA
jgi:hypothetical protein